MLFSAVHRGRGLLHPAVSVQEEEREAHRRGDAVGGPARYGRSLVWGHRSQMEPWFFFFGNQSSFCCLATKNGHLLSSSFQLGVKKEESRSIQIKNVFSTPKLINGRECECRLCCCSLPDRHLSQSRVGDDRRVDKRSAAVHLHHLLRHARRHVCLLWIPDQVSHSLLMFTLLFLELKALV